MLQKRVDALVKGFELREPQRELARHRARLLVDECIHANRAFESRAHIDERWKLVLQKHRNRAFRDLKFEGQPVPVPAPDPVPNGDPLTDSTAAPMSAPTSPTPAFKSKTLTTRWMCQGSSHGHLDDVMNGLYACSTPSMAISHIILMGKHSSTNSRMVQALERRSAKQPYRFEGVKWLTMRSALASPNAPSISMSSIGMGHLLERDYLVYEQLGEIVDAMGQQWAFHVVVSIDEPDQFPSLEQDFRVTRGFVQFCAVYRQMDDQLLTSFALAQIDAHHKLPLAIVEPSISEQLLALGLPNALKNSYAKKYSALIQTNPNVPARHTLAVTTVRANGRQAAKHKLKHKNRDCCVCGQHKGLLSLQTFKECAGCGRVACKKCRTKRMIFSLDMCTSSPERASFCGDCVQSVESSADASSFGRDTMDSSCSHGSTCQSQSHSHSHSHSHGQGISNRSSGTSRCFSFLEDTKSFSHSNRLRHAALHETIGSTHSGGDSTASTDTSLDELEGVGDGESEVEDRDNRQANVNSKAAAVLEPPLRGSCLLESTSFVFDAQELELMSQLSSMQQRMQFLSLDTDFSFRPTFASKKHLSQQLPTKSPHQLQYQSLMDALYQ